MAKKKEVAAVAGVPALMAYLNRVGAELLSFRRAMVKERSKGDAYYIERTLIKIAADGSIDCSRKDHAPTKEEEEDIKAGFKGVKFPRSVGATAASYRDWLSRQKGDHGRFFALLERPSGLIKMVQERRTPTDGGAKYFVSHSFWDDGEWRDLEPDGALPFWKPERKMKPRIMIHEGCKAAKFVHDLTQDAARLKAHPWGEVLGLYEHWGMIGGALAPHRTDYAELKAERPVEVIYVCDNDPPGESALQKVAKNYGASMKGIMFGKHFKMSWDMADPLPDHMFIKGRFVGPTLRSLFQFATYATTLIPPEGGKGRPVAILKEAFKEEWVHAVKPEVFIHKEWPNKIWTLPEFNNKAAPFSDVDDTGRLLKKDAASKSATLKYDPGKTSGIYGHDGRFINTHVPSEIKAEKGDAGPWLEFMELLVPGEGDRKELMRWCATLIARPDIKMLYGVLLISETQGIGKGTLGEKILAPLVGEDNVSTPTENEIVESNFNYWLAHKRLAVVHEIYAGHSSKAYNKLKSIITDRTVTVSKKYMANYDVENWMHIFACSNSMRAIQLSGDDRRWFVPKVTEEKSPPEYWMKFNAWLSEQGGLGIIKWWAEEWLKKEVPVLRGDSAPWSTTKAEVVEEGYSPGMALVARLFDKINEEIAKPKAERWVGKGANGSRSLKIDDNVIILDTDLVALIKDQIYEGRQSDRLEKPLTVRKIARTKGWSINENRASTVPFWKLSGSGSRVLVPKKDQTGVLISTFVKSGRLPLDLRAFLEI
jgi:hypothetical protein